MEIDISAFVTGIDTWPLCGSIATHGADAGPDTWNAAKDQAKATPLLNSKEELQAMRDWAESSGGWDDDEIAAWSDQELNALFIQLVSGDMREAGMNDCDLTGEDNAFDWEAYREASEAGEVSGNIFRGDIEGEASFGRIFYYLGT